MTILLKKVLIVDKQSQSNNLVKDIFISNNVIEKIADDINSNADITVNQPNTIVSPGWIDVFSNFCDPGFEHKENLETGAAAAASGGFTKVCVLPNTNPVISTRSQVNYIAQKSKTLPIDVLPIGAISKNCEGKELSEMYDMYQNGAIAFSDGFNSVQSASLFAKALQYVKTFDGTLIQMPIDNDFAKIGLVNEGIISTQLGLPGIPEFAENLMIKRDIELLQYTNSKLHITGVSTIDGVNLICEAKQRGLQISCSITPHHLFFCDEDLASYDTNLKIHIPLRTRENMMALRQALIDGKIDCIASHHFPQHSDEKVCEFEYAKKGMISLQNLFAVVNTVLPQLPTNDLVNLLSTNVNTIFNLPQHKIEENSIAALTLFNRNENYTLTLDNNKSRSQNSSFINKVLKGKVVGIVNKGNLFLN